MFTRAKLVRVGDTSSNPDSASDGDVITDSRVDMRSTTQSVLRLQYGATTPLQVDGARLAVGGTSNDDTPVELRVRGITGDESVHIVLSSPSGYNVALAIPGSEVAVRLETPTGNVLGIGVHDSAFVFTRTDSDGEKKVLAILR